MTADDILWRRSKLGLHLGARNSRGAANHGLPQAAPAAVARRHHEPVSA